MLVIWCSSWTLAVYGECKGYSRFIQIIWGHWILARSSDSSSESIFSQRVFVDALEKLSRRRSGQSTTSKPSTTGTTSTTSPTTKTTTSTSISTKSTPKATTKQKRSRTTTRKRRTSPMTQTTYDYKTECIFADKRFAEKTNPYDFTTRSSSISSSLPVDIVVKLNLVQENLNEVLKVLNGYGTTEVDKSKRFLSGTRKYSKTTTSMPETSTSKEFSKLMNKYKSLTESGTTTSEEMTPTMTKEIDENSLMETSEAKSALPDNILSRLDHLDKRLGKFIDVKEFLPDAATNLSSDINSKW